MAGKIRNLGSKIFLASGIVLLLALVSFVVWLLHTKFSYQQYLTQLMYMMGGQTTQVEAVGDDGTHCALTYSNQRALYGFLADTYGKRKTVSTVKLTGRSISFTSTSAVGIAEGMVCETESEYVYITYEVGNQKWKYYVHNRAPYEYYVRATSPDGWTEANIVLDETQEKEAG